MGSINSDKRNFRYTNKKWSYETGLAALTVALLWKPIGEPAWQAIKAALPLRSLKYHPAALIGLAAAAAAYLASPQALGVLLWAAICWPIVHQPSYLKHAHSRVQSYLAGFNYRYRLRERLSACSVLREKDRTPPISRVTKKGCITRVRLKMAYGHEINWWREEAPRLAQTYNAGDCKINPYRRDNFLTIRPNGFTRTPPFVQFKFEEKVTKYRWLELDFLTKDPFNSKMGVEFLDYHRNNTLQPVVSVNQSGGTHTHNLAAHRLRIAMTRWGKSVAIRGMVYAQRRNIKEGLIELWGIDGKGGVEQSFMQHVFARVAYGDLEGDVDAYNPAEFDKLLKDAVKVMMRRQRRMRGNVTEHTPTKAEPWLLIVIDEVLILTNPGLHTDLRKSIEGSIRLIQQQGIACGVSLDASTQLAQMEMLPFRKGFTEFELGKIEQGAVDMVFGTGWWQRGARADEISDDLKGAFYKKTESTMAPELIRYPNTRVADVSAKALGFDKHGKSVLWKPWTPRHLEPVNHPPEPPDEPDDEDLESAVMVSDNPFGGVA